MMWAESSGFPTTCKFSPWSRSGIQRGRSAEARSPQTLGRGVFARALRPAVRLTRNAATSGRTNEDFEGVLAENTRLLIGPLPMIADFIEHSMHERQALALADNKVSAHTDAIDAHDDA